MSTSSSVCAAHTQKELLGLHVSAEAAARPHNFPGELPLPRDFDGTRLDQWKNFASELTAYCDMLELSFSNCTRRAAASPGPVTDQRHVLEQDGLRVTDERHIRMSEPLAQS